MAHWRRSGADYQSSSARRQRAFPLAYVAEAATKRSKHIWRPQSPSLKPSWQTLPRSVEGMDAGCRGGECFGPVIFTIDIYHKYGVVVCIKVHSRLGESRPCSPPIDNTCQIWSVGQTDARCDRSVYSHQFTVLPTTSILHSRSAERLLLDKHTLHLQDTVA